MNTLQTVVLPNLDVQAPEDLYVRLNDRAWSELARPALHFDEGGIAHTDTFYGCFSATAWRRHCDVGTLMLALEGEGRFVVTFALHRRELATVWLGEHTVSLSPSSPAVVTVPGWETVKDGLVYFRLRALQAGTLKAARYVTLDTAKQDVRLGLVITHFNRQAQVLPAIQRIRRSVLARPDLRDRVTLTVVDNSRNLPLPPCDDVELIPNRNLGGTGGFVRGLLRLEDEGSHTHALFMDDDASCEPESIARCFAMLRHARSPRLAIAGALISEAHPWHLLEKGARFDGTCKPLHSGLDLRRVDHLVQGDALVERPDYGGWWFFAFPIKGVRRYPFPFFVRGDDVFFGLSNRFEIITLHGIACFGEDFRLKHGPMTAYLDARYHVLHAVLEPSRGAATLLKLGRRLFLKPLLAYHYVSARAFTLAMRHVSEGPQFFRDNLDLAAVRSQIAGWIPAEKMAPLDVSALPLRGPRLRRESRLRRLLRLVTLQGFVLPRALLLDRVQVQEKGYHGSASSVFRFRRVLYEHRASGTGYIAEYDRRLFFAELGHFLRTATSLLVRLPALRRAHALGMEEMCTSAFWREVYGLPSHAAAMPAANESTLQPATAA
jgi:GT2 family glycosyltransferase